jgi:DNA polymerase I
MAAAAQRTFLLFDGHAIIYRAYHAFPDLNDPSGLLVNAVYGFTRIILTAIQDYEPAFIAVAFDHPTPTFRHTDFAEYKAHREEMPDDLKPQIEIIKRVVTSLNIPQFEVPGFEADDLIGTLSAQAETHTDLATVIVTGDRDAFQLVSDKVHVWMPGRGKGSVDTEYDADGVLSKMGVTPAQIIDLKALMGDSSDNIPGVRGIGPKTAIALIQAFGTLEKVYEAVEKVSPGELLPPFTASVLKKLETGKESAFMSKQLATIKRDVPITLALDDCRLEGYKKEEVVTVFDELGFKSLVPLLPADDFELSVQNTLF